jgi:uncharacterized protein YecT (DUF1311 family)
MMRGRGLALIVAVLMLAFAGAGAATAHTDADSFQKNAAELNRVYGQVRAKLSPEGVARLKAAELAWIKFRGLECYFEAMDSEGGSVYPRIVASCKDGIIRARTAQLRTLLHCPEGYMGCVH